MITPSFSLTATERVLPKLALDFTTASLDSRITFTRTTGASNPATYVNNNGYVTSATNNQPRFDYDPTTLACKGLLIEESRSNLLLRSENFFNAAAWTNYILFTEDAVVSPDGNTTADMLTTTGGGGNGVYQSVTVSASTTYTFSLYVKLGTMAASDFKIAFYNNTGAAFIVSDVVPTQTPNPSSWTRITYSVTTPVGCTSMRCYVHRNSATISSSTVYLWGAQLEAGTFATSYIPTTSAALTRNADVAVMTGTNFSDWFNASEGTFELSGIPMTTASSGALSADDGTSNQRMQMRALSNGGQSFIVDGGVTQANLATGTWAVNVLGGCAFAYKANSFVCAAGGVNPATDTAGTVPTVNRLVIGGSAGVNQTTFNGRIAKLNYWPQRVTNSETQAFSKV